MGEAAGEVMVASGGATEGSCAGPWRPRLAWTESPRGPGWQLRCDRVAGQDGGLCCVPEARGRTPTLGRGCDPVLGAQDQRLRERMCHTAGQPRSALVCLALQGWYTGSAQPIS